MSGRKWFGRWKIPIIIAVSFGSKGFKEIARELTGITDKTLSKELKDLEVNQLQPMAGPKKM